MSRRPANCLSIYTSPMDLLWTMPRYLPRDKVLVWVELEDGTCSYKPGKVDMVTDIGIPNVETKYWIDFDGRVPDEWYAEYDIRWPEHRWKQKSVSWGQNETKVFMQSTVAGQELTEAEWDRIMAPVYSLLEREWKRIFSEELNM